LSIGRTRPTEIFTKSAKDLAKDSCSEEHDRPDHLEGSGDCLDTLFSTAKMVELGLQGWRKELQMEFFLRSLLFLG
jgi:hypothetical protein